MSEVLVQPDVPEERLYWIYSVDVAWKTKHSHSEYCKPDERDLCNDSTHANIAFRTEPSVLECCDRLHCLLASRSERHPMLQPSFHMQLRFRAEWWLTWFAHSTFDVGQTDEEAVESFQNYVWWAEEFDNDPLGPPGKPSICLMGAEDQWRWRAGPDDSNEAPPCRCPGCRKNGVLMICH